MRESDGRVLVEIRTSSTSDATVSRLRALGARTVNVSHEYSRVTAAVAPAALSAISADPDVVYVNEVLAPLTGNLGFGDQAPAAQPAAAGCHPTIPESDTEMNVAAARATNNIDGTGVTIGILSDSYNTDTHASTHAAHDISTGDLPGTGNPCGRTTPVTVQVDDTFATNHDEGRALAELAHAMAPGAHLAFASAAKGELDFANRITTLRTTNHASVIVDDMQYLDEPFFQDGPIAQAANAATAAGVPYFSAAGNANLIVGGNDVSSYETPGFRATSCPATVLQIEGSVSCHDFNPTGSIDNGDDVTLASGGGFGLDLQWAQPWGAVSNDYDVFVLDSSGRVLAGSNLDQAKFQEPFEFLGYTNTSASAQTVRIVIAKFSGGVDPRMKFVMLGAGGVTAVQYHASTGGDIVGPSIFGHNGATTVASVAAVPYNNASTSEFFSSRGPVTHYFEPTPGTNALGSPDVLAKPDFAATDRVKNVFFGTVTAGVHRFAGTSAAVANAAGIGALLKEHDPALSPAEIIAALANTARPVATNGAPTDVGSGYLDAAAALASVTPLSAAPTGVVATNGESQSSVHWTAAPLSNPNFPTTSYLVTPIKDGIAQPPVSSGSNATTFVVPGLTNGSTYTFTVAAENANGPGPASSESNAIDLGVPDEPTAVDAVPGNGEAALSWTPPPASDITITGYEVTPFVGAVAQTPQTFADTTPAQTITGLTNGTAYSFEVAAIDSFTTGPPSTATGAITVGAPVAPDAPTMTYDGSTVSIGWAQPAADNGSPVTGFNVDVIGPGGSVHSFGPTTTAWTATGLANGNTYAFAVAAANANGNGPYSLPSKSVTPGSPIAPPAPVPTSSGNRSATVSWHAPLSGPAASTGYVITAYDAGVSKGTISASSTLRKKAFPGLTNGTSYQFTVTGVNGSGVGQESLPSAPIVVGLPSASDSIGAVTGNGRATVHWHAASGNGSTITKYLVTPYYGSTAQSTRTFNSAATTETVEGLTNGRQYTFKVAAVNGFGTGPKSPASRVIRIGVPKAPTGVTAVTATRAAKLHWTAPGGNGGAITGYIVTPYMEGHAQTPVTFHSAATNEIVRGLKSGHIYTFRVAATNSRGHGDNSTDSNRIRVK